MNAQQKPKRHHHHVWQKYLKPWTINGLIWCLQDDRIFPTGTPVVAVEKDFYKLHRLTAKDVDLIKLLFGQGAPWAVRTHANLLNNLMAPFQIVDQVKPPGPRAKLEAWLDEYASNVLEDCHTSIEHSFIPTREEALQGDISFYQDDQRCIPFLNYLSTQYMRTKGVKERSIDGSADLTRIWNIIIHMFATNVGAGLYRERKQRKLVLVNNRTNIPFITGDQPAINLKGARPKPPERFSLYYPISPTLALILGDVDEEPPYAAKGLTAGQASTLNQQLFEASYKQVFAQSEAALRALLPQP
jgi:hypothetical protein